VKRCNRYGAIQIKSHSATGSKNPSRDQQSPIEPAEGTGCRRCDCDDHHTRAEVGLAQPGSANGDDHGKQRQEAVDERLLERLLSVQEIRFAHCVARGVQHDKQLHEFGGLNVDDHQREPAPAAVDCLANARHEHCDEQCSARDEKVRREPSPDLDRHLKRDDRREHTGSDEHRVACQEIPRPIAGVSHGFGGRDRRRVDHHQADGEQ
jgi:hypothetical protein